jgi:hypothetical protein
MLETVKPPLPADPAFARLHFLLYTAFRHPPLRHGSRFGARTERGIWYGSLTLPAVFAEVAYYRLLFLEGSAADLGTVTVELSSFRAAVETRKGVDLTKAPFARYESRISSRTSYTTSQRLGRDMRGAGVEAFVYRSARDLEGGRNVGLFVPVFSRRTPSALSNWLCVATRERVEVKKKDLLRKQHYAFDRKQFEVDGVLPSPAL